jgi:Calcineurin-like phosphoesterase
VTDGQDRSSSLDPRSIAVGVIAFVATLALLFGLGSIIGSSPSGSPAGGSPTYLTGRPVSAQPDDGSAAPGPSAGGASESPVATTGSPAPTPSGSDGPSGAKSAVLVGAGDIADCGLDADRETARLIDKIDGTVFTAGDNVYPTGSLAQYRDCYAPTWGRFFDRTRPAPGNHEHLTGGADGYLAYFGKAAAPDGTLWYSYDLGAWHIIVLDGSCDTIGGCGLDDPQGRWLADDLATSKAGCTLAIWHQPRWSSGEHGGDPSMGPYWRALYRADADAVVNGHDHDYERFRPQDPDGNLDPERGIREFVVGTGGAALRSFSTVAANSAIRVAGVHGIIRFDLGQTGYDWRFISTTGEVTDSGHDTCH